MNDKPIILECHAEINGKQYTRTVLADPTQKHNPAVTNFKDYGWKVKPAE